MPNNHNLCGNLLLRKTPIQRAITNSWSQIKTGVTFSLLSNCDWAIIYNQEID